MIIKSLCDTDLYKITMMAAVFDQFSEVNVQYSFVNRTKNVKLGYLKERVVEEVIRLDDLKFSVQEIEFLRKQGLFNEKFLNFLSSFKLNHKNIVVEEIDGELRISSNGLWLDTILYEIYVLAIVNELHYQATAPTAELTEIPYLRLINKINEVKEFNKKENHVNFKFSEFGSRRRYSQAWQERVLGILKHELPHNLVSTSNVHLAMKYNMPVTGTAAHEFYAVQEVLAGVPKTHKATWDSWLKQYGTKLGVVLTDIYTTDRFLLDLTETYAMKLQGFRQDSGNPLEWGDKIIKKLHEYKIDPLTKKAVFSDSLNIPKALTIFKHFENRLNMVFGIGTNLTNDLGPQALNIVMKVTECNGQPVVKLSDDVSKAVGDPARLAEVKLFCGVV